MAAGAPAQSQPAAASPEIVDVYTEHPRLFLTAQRLRLLRREQERRTTRWVQFETLVAGRAPMPEMGFAQALFYKISGEKDYAARAIAWALAPANNDLRQLAIVFDWCQDALAEAQSKALQAKLVKGIAAAERERGIPAVRNRTLAAVALAGHDQQLSTRHMEWVVRTWWNGEIAPGLRDGKDLLPRDSMYPLAEILNAVRDNTNIELRDGAQAYFKELPVYQLLSYYPAPYQASENDYRIPSAKGLKEPDLNRATMARAAELALVAYDTNSTPNQFLQGWLMHDNFQMRGMLGAPYELLWANPYQPGLSYFHVPLLLHDELFGRLFIRASWEQDAKWFGYFGDEAQIFENGRPASIDPRTASEPVQMTEALVLPAKFAAKFRMTLEEEQPVFIVGMKPRQAYEIEVDDEEMRELTSDAGGILPIQLPAKAAVGVRIREVRP
jgi:hypothetical protein